MKLVAGLVILAFSIFVSAGEVPTVSNYSISQYAGHWYQIGDYPQFYELFCNYCTTANYTVNADGTVGVHNQCRASSVTGKLTSIDAVGTIPDASQPAKLKVKFFKLFNGDYWIMKLGPVTGTGAAAQYSWALVSDRNRLSLYILSRTPTLPNATMTEINTFLKLNGFDPGKVKMTPHAGCAPTLGAPLDTSTLYKISDGECGQATLDSKYAPYAKTFAGLKDGDCASVGYTVADGTQTINVPVIGNVVVSKFKKA
jgi:apolipoprotein D and lipocalin family protein